MIIEINLISFRHQKLASAEVREGVSYQTGCSLDAAISDDIQSIPAPVITPEYLPLEPKTLNDSCMTYFDVETTGLGKDYLLWQKAPSI